MTQPIFIIGSGRCGTSSFARMFRDVGGLTSYHEYRDFGFPDLETCRDRLWINADYRLSWHVKELAVRYPNAKFFHLVRDGRKVVPSFFYKIPDEQFPIINPGVPRFERCCYQWTETNEIALESLAKLPGYRWRTHYLEELVSDEVVLRSVIRWLGISQDPAYFEYLQYPRNVLVPHNYHFTQEQQAIFDQICGPTMKRLGYADRPEYDIEYENPI